MSFKGCFVVVVDSLRRRFDDFPKERPLGLDLPPRVSLSPRKRRTAGRRERFLGGRGRTANGGRPVWPASSEDEPRASTGRWMWMWREDRGSGAPSRPPGQRKAFGSESHGRGIGKSRIIIILEQINSKVR